MKVTLPELERAGMMVVGDVILDRYWYGSASHVPLGTPVSVVGANTIEERPGGAANMAINIASLGANTHLVGLMGTDDTACAPSESLTDVNVKHDFASVPTHPTITKLRILSYNQRLIRLDFEESFKGADPQPLYERISQTPSSIGALVFSDYTKGTLIGIQQMIQPTRKAGVPVLIDSKGADFECCYGATLLTPNLSESEAVADKCKAEEKIVERGMRLITDYKFSALLMTHSEQDMSLLQPGRAPLHMPTQTQEMYDATGVGDMVIGVLAATLAADNPLEEACFFANATAGVMVGKLGISTASPTRLENTVRGCTDTGLGVMAEEELKFAVATAHKCGEKVMMTNGVFGILHAGYIFYLVNTCKLDDRLTVAMDNDTLTKRLKEDSRPANSFEQCMIVLGTLEMVNQMASSEEDTPQCLIAGTLSDLLMKGGNYKLEETVGSKGVWASGGEVLALNSEDGCLAISIIKKIQLDRKGQLENGSQISLRNRQIY